MTNEELEHIRSRLDTLSQSLARSLTVNERLYQQLSASEQAKHLQSA